MAFDIENPIGEGTDAELLVLCRAMIARILAGGVAYTAYGVAMTFANLPDLQKNAEWLEARINSTSPDRANKDNLVRFKRPQ